jgi:hypothetical protein
MFHGDTVGNFGEKMVMRPDTECSDCDACIIYHMYHIFPACIVCDLKRNLYRFVLYEKTAYIKSLWPPH